MGREEKQNGQVKAAAGENEEQEQKENELMNECLNEWIKETVEKKNIFESDRENIEWLFVQVSKRWKK